jgi:hypothetical protein
VVSGLVDKVLKMADVVAMIDSQEAPAVRGPCKKKTAEISRDTTRHDIGFHVRLA